MNPNAVTRLEIRYFWQPGRDLPFRETFISTRGPVRSLNAAASPHAILATLRHANATAQLATVNLEKYLRNLGRCKHPPLHFPAWVLGFVIFEIHRANGIIPRHANSSQPLLLEIFCNGKAALAAAQPFGRSRLAGQEVCIPCLASPPVPCGTARSSTYSSDRSPACTGCAALRKSGRMPLFNRFSEETSICPSARFVAHFLGHIRPPRVAGVVNQQNMNHRIGPLCRLNCLFHPQPASPSSCASVIITRALRPASVASLSLQARNTASFKCVPPLFEGIVPRRNHAPTHCPNARLVNGPLSSAPGHR